MEERIERDSMGEIAVPGDVLYGAQTQRAINNFTISRQPLPESFIRALILIKKIAAQANRQLQVIDTEIADAIIAACEQLLNTDDLQRHFPVSVYQTGSGTSTNMNANEVIAHLATQHGKKSVHPNDHVNAGQSSNDVIPSSIHVSAALAIHQQLLPALSHFVDVTTSKANRLRDVVKTGRTHLMDAMPVRMDQVINGWAQQIIARQQAIEAMQPAMQTLAQGGTAVGTGINAHPQFSSVFCQLLSKATKLQFTSPTSFFTHIGTQDSAVALSGQLKTLSVALTKIANDLRWMNSGPLAGI
ncbi:MAG: fumarate hydratase class II, partial [Cellvibrionaceae bacterium]